METVGTRDAPLPAPGGRGRRAGRDGSERLLDRVAAGGDGGGASGLAREAGARLAREGAGLGEALERLRRAALGSGGGEPPFRVLRDLAVGWAEAAWGDAPARSCQDPLTGLASPAHLRARLEEVYREADLLGERVPETHALVVVDMPRTATTGKGIRDGEGDGGADGRGTAASPLARALDVLEVAERIRRVFPGEETLCRARRGRLLVLARRTTHLRRDVARVRELADTLGRGPFRAGVEDLPGTVDGAAALVAALAGR